MDHIDNMQHIMEQNVRLAEALRMIRNTAIEHCHKHEFAKFIVGVCDMAVRIGNEY